jgi:hypothetical protein
MEKIPTAGEFLKEAQSNPSKGWTTRKVMIEFAKMHVEEALKDLEQKLNTALDDHLMLEENVCSILENINSYSLEKIK